MLSRVCSPLTKSGCRFRRCLCSRCRRLRANSKGAGLTIPWQKKINLRPFTRSRSKRGSMIWGRGTGRRPLSTISLCLKGAPTPSDPLSFSRPRALRISRCLLVCWVCGVWCMHVCVKNCVCVCVCAHIGAACVRGVWRVVSDVWCVVHVCMYNLTKKKHAYSCNERRR